MTPNFSPPNYLRATVRGGLGAGAGPLTKVGSPETWAFKFGRRKLFFENFFSAESCRAKPGRNFPGIRGVTFIPFQSISQGGIAIFWLRFGTGSPGNWGSHGPPKLGSNFGHFSNAPEKYRGWSWKVFLLREYLASGSVTGDPHPPPPFSPEKFLRGLNFQNLTPYSPKSASQISFKLPHWR